MFWHDAVNLGGGVAMGPGGASAGVADDTRGRVLDAIGLRRRPGDEARLHAWLQSRLRELRLPSIAAYAELIEAGGADSRRERERLMRLFSTGETYFLRDQGLFGLLAGRILPELVARRSAQRTLRLWSAGCASGEEAYSLAMLIDEMSPCLGGWDVRILGTDINGDAIARARTGRYGQWSFRALDDDRIARYFRECGREWQISEHLQAMVEFACGDLLHDDSARARASADAGGFDLILCRNVFIYLTTPAVTHIAGHLAVALAEGGYFVPGHGELLGETPSGLEAVPCPEAMLYRRPVGAAQRQPEGAAPAVAPAAVPPPSPASTPLERARRRKPVPARETAAPVDPDELLVQAWRDADRGAAQAARAACERVLAASPLDPRPYFLLAQLAEEGGAFDEAVMLLRKVLYLDSRFVVAHLALADLCVRSGEADRARQMRALAVRELERMAPDAPLPAPPRTTAGALLHRLRAGAGELRGVREEGRDG
ncbi:protein-glutamate O-methyltransferase CheR [Aromatoleum evansii]|uniref:Protein-glutamate O-methyltransferase CheR n=1 Tax=Aromatoleum evansii TaxID=59406 RepID=A0ABZ1AMU3_AROEV|nr:protein-glutamate O-methyltransferase CheR [Aromatoleum evansii]